MSNTTPRNITARRNGARVQIPCRLSHAHLKEPFSFAEVDVPKYSARVLISKEDAATLKIVKEAIAEAHKTGVIAKWEGSTKGKIHNCLMDGDVPNEDTGETQPENEGNFYINSKSKNPVGVFNRALEKIDPEEAYSGCYAVASINFYPYAAGSKKGVGAGLNNIVKVADGERFGGTGDGSRDFDGMDFGLEELDSFDLSDL